jgi:predicted MFS family arabinose efflux permease
VNRRTDGDSLAAALALGLSVAAGHGIGRFGYALVMPAMQADMHWTFEQASWMNTANALGYVAGTLTGFLMLRWVTPRALFRWGLLLTAGSVLTTSAVRDLPLLALMRVISGLGTAWSFSTGAALVAERYADSPVKGAATGLFFGCAGVGMVITALTAPGLLDHYGAQWWPYEWALLGIACALLAWWPWREARNAGASIRAAAAGSPNLTRPAMTVMAYLLYAAAHTGYVFFVFAWTQQQHLPWWHGAGMWILMALGVLLSPFLWSRALGTWHAPATLAACCAVVSAGAALALLNPEPVTVAASAFLVGTALFIGPSAMAVLARQTLPQAQWSAALMAYAVVFSVGQSLGSWLFGVAADAHSLNFVLGAASAGLAAAGAIAAADWHRLGRKKRHE